MKTKRSMSSMRSYGLATFTPIAVGLAVAALVAAACAPEPSRRGLAAPPTPVPPAPATPEALYAAVLTAEADLPVALATDETHLYWVTAGGTLHRVHKGGSAPRLVAQDARGPIALAVGDDAVYWSVVATDGSGALLRAPKSGGGAITALADGRIGAVAVDGPEVTWIAGEDDGRTTVIRADADGAKPAVVATFPAPVSYETHAFAFGPASVYWLESRGGSDDVVGTWVHRVPRDGGELELLSHLPASWLGGGPVAADGASVAWIDSARRLREVHADGGEAVDVDPDESFRAFALEETGVLAVPRYTPRLVRYAAGAADAEVVHETRTAPEHLIVDGDSVYWAEWTSECTVERYEGKSAWCAAYRFELQLVRAAR